MADLKEQLSVAQAFCAEHLQQCCVELIELDEKAVLPHGKVRELAQLCSFAQHNALSVAQAMVKIAALKAVADGVKVAPTNPYRAGVPAENWRRGFNGERLIAAPGSAAARYYDEGKVARKAHDAGVVAPDVTGKGNRG